MAMPPTWMRAAFNYTNQSAGFVNVLWYSVDVSPAPADPGQFAADCADALGTAISPAFKNWLASDTELRHIEVSVSLNGQVHTANSLGFTGPGTVLGDSLPAYAAAIIQKRTAVGGRTGRGRWYVGGVPEASTDDSFLDGAGQTLLTNLAIAFKADVTVGTTVWKAQHHHGGSPGNLAPLTTVRGLITLGTLRRRMVPPRA